MMIDKRLMAMIPEVKRYIAGKVAANWVSLLAGILLWFTAAGILERAYLREDMHLALAFGMIAVCIIVRFIAAHIAATMTHKAVSETKLRLRDTIYEKLRRLGGNYQSAFPTAEVVQLAGEGVEQLESYFGNYLPQLIYAGLAPLTLFAVFFPLSPLTAIVLFICVPLIPVAIMSVQKIAKRLLGKYWGAYANLGDSFLENLQGLTTLKVYGADQARHEAMNAEAEHFRKITMKVLTMQLNSVTVMDFVACGGTALGSILGARTFANGTVSLGGAIAMILLASELFLAMRALGSYFHVAMHGVAASERIFRLLDLPEPHDGGQTAQDGDIVLKQLSFSYDAHKRALDQIDLTIPQGSFVSFCGKSGCGKSTLAGLISGTLEDYQGQLLLHGMDLKEISRSSLRKIITVISNNSYLFAGTVRETLLEGKQDATEAELMYALQCVKLSDFVMAQGGLDMPISERGDNLSGGQRQRLALARALLKNSPIYIFDEATSNIDAESENDVMHVIHGLRGKHTVILISHRLANVADSDRIFFLHGGCLTESGTQAELVERHGGYAEIFSAQQKLEQYGKEVERCTETG